MKSFKETISEASQHERVKAHPAVESVDDGGRGEYFVCLKPGYHYSQQRSFGCEHATEALKLLKHVEQGDPFGEP